MSAAFPRHRIPKVCYIISSDCHFHISSSLYTILQVVNCLLFTNNQKPPENSSSCAAQETHPLDTTTYIHIATTCLSSTTSPQSPPHPPTNTTICTTTNTPNMPLRLTEPHPTASPKMTFGRGGAGNSTRLPPPTSLHSTTSHLTSPSYSSKSSHSKYTTGRGGAGNLHLSTDERPMFRFDEELERERLKGEAAPVYHVGRGGSGNAVNERRGSSGSEDSGRTGSKRGSLDWMRGVVKRV